MSENLHEKCAVAAVSLANGEMNAAAYTYDLLDALQHRGPEASGIATTRYDGSMGLHRAPGMVRDVYKEGDLTKIAGSVAIGHNRYTTSGAEDQHLQPVKDRASGFAMAHNGNLPDTSELEDYLDFHNLAHGHLNDSEMMSYAVAQEIRTGKDLPTAIESLSHLFAGAYSCVAMHRDMVVAFRDPYGIRPLSIGQIDNDYFISSETCGLDTIGAEDHVRDINPGEMVIIQDGQVESRQLTDAIPKLDIFELVYFARHDSRMFGQSMYEFRRKFGQQLAMEHPPIVDDLDNVVVAGVPDTSIPIAEGYAKALGLDNSQAIVKNRYVGRTFMQPGNAIRRKQLRRKHNIVREPIAGKDVIMIDDSIVRGNTMERLVKIVQDAGATSVQVLIGSPPVRFPNFYGIDTASQQELIAAHMTTEEIRKKTGCDYLGYLSLGGLIKATGQPFERFELSCFNGEYPIDIGARKHDISTPVSMQYAD
jgi:amidophosphoribosyltransferase